MHDEGGLSPDGAGTRLKAVDVSNGHYPRPQSIGMEPPLRPTSVLVVLGERVCSLSRDKVTRLVDSLGMKPEIEALSVAIERMRIELGEKGLCLMALAYLTDRLAEAIVDSMVRYYERSLLKTGLPPLYGEFRFEVFERLVSGVEGPFEPYLRRARIRLQSSWRSPEELAALEPLSLDPQIALAFDKAFAGLWKLADCAICWLLRDELVMARITGAVTVAVSKRVYAQRMKDSELGYGTLEPWGTGIRASVYAGELRSMVEELLEEACYRCRAKGP